MNVPRMRRSRRDPQSCWPDLLSSWRFSRPARLKAELARTGRGDDALLVPLDRSRSLREALEQLRLLADGQVVGHVGDGALEELEGLVTGGEPAGLRGSGHRRTEGLRSQSGPFVMT